MVRISKVYWSPYGDDVVVRYKRWGDRRTKFETEVVVVTDNGEQLKESKIVNLKEKLPYEIYYKFHRGYFVNKAKKIIVRVNKKKKYFVPRPEVCIPFKKRG